MRFSFLLLPERMIILSPFDIVTLILFIFGITSSRRVCFGDHLFWLFELKSLMRYPIPKTLNFERYSKLDDNKVSSTF